MMRNKTKLAQQRQYSNTANGTKYKVRYTYFAIKLPAITITLITQRVLHSRANQYNSFNKSACCGTWRTLRAKQPVHMGGCELTKGSFGGPAEIDGERAGWKSAGAISRGQAGGRAGDRAEAECAEWGGGAVPHPCQGPAQSARCRCWCSFARSVLLCRAVCLCHASCLLLSRLRSLLGESPPPPHPTLRGKPGVVYTRGELNGCFKKKWFPRFYY